MARVSIGMRMEKNTTRGYLREANEPGNGFAGTITDKNNLKVRSRTERKPENGSTGMKTGNRSQQANKT